MIKAAAVLADALGVPLVALFKKPRTKQPGPGGPESAHTASRTVAGQQRPGWRRRRPPALAKSGVRRDIASQ